MVTFMKLREGHTVNMDHVVCYTPPGARARLENVNCISTEGILSLSNRTMFVLDIEDCVAVEKYFGEHTE